MDILWVDADRLEKLEPERDFDEIARNARGVWKTQSPVVAEIPLLLDTESVSSDEELSRLSQANRLQDIPEDRLPIRDAWSVVQLPTCRLCKHAVDLLSGDRFLSEDRVCVFPASGNQVASLLLVGHEYGCMEASFRDEQDFRKGLAEIELARVWNRLLENALQNFPDVSRQDRQVEGMVQETGRFHGPLCPDFSLDEDHIELDDSPYRKLRVTMPLVFGVENFAAALEKKSMELATERVEQGILWLRSLYEKDAAVRGLLKTRVEMADCGSEQWKRLLEFLDSSESLRQALAHGSHSGALRGFFNVSNKVWENLCSHATKSTDRTGK